MSKEAGLEKSIRVRVLGREYALRVHPGDEDLTRDVAAYVDAKMQAFQQAHPGQSELTAAVITALAITEELYTTWEDADDVDDALEALADRLGDVLGTPEAASDRIKEGGGEAD